MFQVLAHESYGLDKPIQIAQLWMDEIPVVFGSETSHFVVVVVVLVVVVVVVDGPIVLDLFSIYFALDIQSYLPRFDVCFWGPNAQPQEVFGCLCSLLFTMGGFIMTKSPIWLGISRWWFQTWVLFCHYLGKWSDLTSIFFRWMVQPPTTTLFLGHFYHQTLLRHVARTWRIIPVSK